MEANELRIGNWVYEMGIDYIGEYPIVDELDKTPVLVDLPVLNAIENHDGTTDMPYYTPIPLTPEILEMAGFERHHADYYTDALMLKPVGSIWEVWLYPTPKPQSAYNATNIRCLHQLQNLYFALTGQELTIDLNH